MTDRMRRRWWAGVLLAASLVLPGCIDDANSPSQPEPRASATAPPKIRLGDISVGSTALAQRAGLYMCGERIVASAPAGGIEGDSFVVFDTESGRGEITEVDLPRGLRPNARWLLTTRCVESDGRPLISVAYQEMPLPPSGGSGVRAAYSLDGRQLWMRDDLNQPGTVVDDVLVLGSAPEQPETAVDLRTGRTVATFDPAVQSRTVVASERMVVRGLSGPPLLTTLTGQRIAALEQASSYTADGGLLFGTTPAALPDPGASPQPTADRNSDRNFDRDSDGNSERGSDGGPDGLTDASPSPSPTRTDVPGPATGLSQGEVRAYSLRTGQPQWTLDLAPDPLGLPTVEPETGIVSVVDARAIVHGIDPVTGREQWRTPAEIEHPRVTAASGMVLFDKIDDPFQKLVDARTGLPLPEPEEPIVDLQENGALQVVDGVTRVMSPAQLRNPPPATEETIG